MEHKFVTDHRAKVIHSLGISVIATIENLSAVSRNDRG